MTYTISSFFFCFLEYLEIYIYRWPGVIVKFYFFFYFSSYLWTSFPILPSPSLSSCLLLLWFCSLTHSLLRILSLSCVPCFALDCQSGVCCSWVSYGNKETFTFFKTEAIKQMGIAALGTEGSSQCRGLNNRMWVRGPIDVGWGLLAEALCLDTWPSRPS